MMGLLKMIQELVKMMKNLNLIKMMELSFMVSQIMSTFNSPLDINTNTLYRNSQYQCCYKSE